MSFRRTKHDQPQSCPGGRCRRRNRRTLRACARRNTPGVTATSVKIGNTMPYSGPASTYGVIGRTESAFFKMVNEQGGVTGHTIDFISYDDGYSPPKTVEQVRRLVEEDQVDFCFQNLGTPMQFGNRATT